LFGLGGEFGVTGVASEWRREWPGYGVLEKSLKGLKQVILASSDHSIACFDFVEPLSVKHLKSASWYGLEDDHNVLLREIEDDPFEPDKEKLEALMSMGFDQTEATQALYMNDENVQFAVDWLLAKAFQ